MNVNKIVLGLLSAATAATTVCATDVIVQLDELNAIPATNRTIEVRKLQPFSGNPDFYYTTNGLPWFGITNAAVADYAVNVRQRGSASAISFNFTVAATNLGVIGAHTNLSVIGSQTYPTTGKSAWSIAASDARYARAGEAGTVSGDVITNDHTAAVTLSNSLTVAQTVSVGTYISVGGVLVAQGQIGADEFVGSGALLSNLPAAQVTGTLPTSVLPSGVLTNNNADDVRFAGRVAAGTNYTERVENTNTSSLVVSGGGVNLTLASGAASLNSPYFFLGRYVGDGYGLTNIPLTGVLGLYTALAWLTNNAGGNMSTAEFQARVYTNQIPGSNIVGDVTADSLTVSGALTVGSVSGDGSGLTGVNASFATNSPHNGPLTGTNAPTFYGPIKVQMPTALFASSSYSNVSIGSTQTFSFDSYQNYFRALLPPLGFKFSAKSSTGDVDVLTIGTNHITSAKIFNINDEGGGFRGPATETKDTFYSPNLVGRQMPVPVLGWNSYYEAPGHLLYGAPLTPALITNVVQRRIANGMRDAGFNTIAIDDAWMAVNRVANRIVPNPTYWPDGLQPIIAWVHSQGFKFEIYLSPGVELTCGGYAGSPFRFLEQDITDCIAWGVDGFKLDRCTPYTDAFSETQFLRKVATLANWAIFNSHDKVGYNFTNGMKQIYILGSSDSYYDGAPFGLTTIARPTWTALGGFNAWQSQEPSIVGIPSVTNMLLRLTKAQNSIWFRGIGHFEELLPFSTGTNIFSYHGSTSNECRTAMSAAALCPSPVYPNEATTNIFAFTNRTVNKIIQDPGCVPGVFIYSNDYVRALTRPLYPLRGTNSSLGESTENVVGIFNPNATGRDVVLDVGMMNLKSNVAYVVYDCWSNSVATTFSNSFTWTIIGDRADLLKIYPSTNYVYNPNLGDLVTTPAGQLSDSYSSGVIFEKDDFTRFRFIVSGNQGQVGDLGWYYWTILGGTLATAATPNTYTTNWPRVGIMQLGNTSTTATHGFQFSPTSQYESNLQTLQRPDLWTNWNMKFVIRLTNTNGVNYRIGLAGGSTYALTADAEYGAYFRFNTNSAINSQWQLIVKKGSTVVTNNMGLADPTYFHTFKLYNDTGITNVIRAQIDSGTIISVTNGLGNIAVAPQIYGHSLGGTGTAPNLWIDYYQLYLAGLTK